MSFTDLGRVPDQQPADEERPPDVGAARPRRHRVRWWVTTVLAALLVLLALVGPDRLTRATPAAFVRVPLEVVLLVPLALVLPRRARRILAVFVGLTLGLLTIVKIFDLGFYAVLDRPFDVVYDWTFVHAGVDFLTSSVGHTGTVAVIVGVALLSVAILTGMTLSVLRLTRIAERHPKGALRTAGGLGVAWVACFTLGAQLVPGVPVAADAYGRLSQIPASIKDRQEFGGQIQVDAYAHTPGSRLLTGLRGKDVMLTFIESYGRSAVDDPDYAKKIDSLLDAGTAQLKAAGYGSRSAYLVSPTAGGGSWLAHSTLLSGLWIDNAQRYSSLVGSKRFTLANAFKRAGWKTVSIMPGWTTKTWSEEALYGYDQVYGRWTMGYQGPRFNWGMPPDQYTLSAFQKDVMTPGHVPTFTEMPLVSSHAPWAPTPRMIDWNAVGDGSAFNGMPQTGKQPDAVWKNAWHDAGPVRAAYRDSIAYSLQALLGYVQHYGSKNLVLIFLGDHQAAPIVTGDGASHDVPITVVAQDPAVLDQISSWGWQDGLRPGGKAPVWQMDTFRNRFLAAFGSKTQPAK